jgi:flotillin
VKDADIKRQRIEMLLAEAARRKMTMETEASAASTRMQGEAHADIVLKKGEAEAKTMNAKADAYQELEPVRRNRAAHPETSVEPVV